MSNSTSSNTYTVKLDFKPGPHLEAFKEYKTSKGYNCRVEVIQPGTWGEHTYGRYYAAVKIIGGPMQNNTYFFWVEGPKAGHGVYEETKSLIGNILITNVSPRKQTQLHLL